MHQLPLFRGVWCVSSDLFCLSCVGLDPHIALLQCLNSITHMTHTLNQIQLLFLSSPVVIFYEYTAIITAVDKILAGPTDLRCGCVLSDFSNITKAAMIKHGNFVSSLNCIRPLTESNCPGPLCKGEQRGKMYENNLPGFS